MDKPKQTKIVFFRDYGGSLDAARTQDEVSDFDTLVLKVAVGIGNQTRQIQLERDDRRQLELILYVLGMGTSVCVSQGNHCNGGQNAAREVSIVAHGHFLPQLFF